MQETDRERINTLMRNIFSRMRSESSAVPVVYLHINRTRRRRPLAKWNPGSVMYDFFIDELASGKK